jgi:hypothetical protein
MLKPRYDIVSKYTVLHFDEWDILFAGKNAYDEWIIGSLAYDDEENNVLHHYYLVVSEKSIIRFLKRDISYRKLFQEAIVIFKTLKDINENLIEKPIELVFEEINKNSLPSEKGFCPESDEQEILLNSILKHEMAFSNNWNIINLGKIKISLKQSKHTDFSNFRSNSKHYGSDRNTRKYDYV